MSLEQKAADVILGNEGFLSKAAYDVNAWRIGVGSDKITLPDGTVRSVKEGDTTTKELALQNLAYRVSNEYVPRLIKQIGSDTFFALSDNALIALLDLMYNYGKITKPKIIEAAKSLDEKKLASTIVSATINDNKHLPLKIQNALKARRQREANLILSTVKTSSKESTEKKTTFHMNIFSIIFMALIGWAIWHFVF